MVTLKELREHFYIPEYRDNGLYLIHEKEPGTGSRMVYKYLCTAKHKNGYWQIQDFKGTGKLDKIKENINKHVNSLPYSSEYYMPVYREGLFEELVITDYMYDLGFKYRDVSWGGTSFSTERDNIYGKSDDISISIYGLDCFGKDGIKENVSISYFTSGFSWVSIETKRDVGSIKEGISALLKPLLITNAVSDIKMSEKLEDPEEIDLIISKLTPSLDEVSVSAKAYLKTELLKLAESL